MSKWQDDPETFSAAVLATDVRSVLRALKRRLREQAHPGDLTASQVSVLSLLESEGPATVTALARAEGVRPQSMGATVASLEAAGLVAGTPDPADGRRTILSLTPACRAWIEAGRAARQDWLAASLHKTLDPAEREEVARAVALLKRVADA